MTSAFIDVEKLKRIAEYGIMNCYCTIYCEG